jgi:hypothetical protein
MTLWQSSGTPDASAVQIGRLDDSSPLVNDGGQPSLLFRVGERETHDRLDRPVTQARERPPLGAERQFRVGEEDASQVPDP